MSVVGQQAVPDQLTRLQRGFDRWSFEEYALSGRDLGIIRILYGCYALLFAIPDLDPLASQPDVSLNPPPGPFVFLGSWPSEGAVSLVEVLLVLCVVALTLGYRTSTISFLTTAMWWANLGLLYSNGKISHGAAFFAVVPLFCGLAGWGARYSVDAHIRGRAVPIRAWPMAFGAFTLGLMFFTAAIPKIQAGWLLPSSHAVQRSVLTRFYIQENAGPWAEWVVDIENGLFWELVDIATIGLEAGFILLVWRRRTFLAGLIVATLLHFSIWKVLGINFSLQVASYGAFLRWGDILRAPAANLGALRTTLRRYGETIVVVVVAVAAFVIYRYADSYGSSRGMLVPSLRRDLVPWTYWIAMALSVGFILQQARGLLGIRAAGGTRADGLGASPAKAETHQGKTQPQASGGGTQ